MAVQIGAFALIFDDQNHVLLCHRRDLDLWNLPGGGMEPGETPWDALMREVHEEVGLVVEVDRLAGVYAKPEQGESSSRLSAVWSGESSGPPPKPTQ